jgi:hypothetical protein
MFTKLMLVAVLGLPLCAQPRRPEIFVNLGAFRAAGDESSLGTGASLGGSVVLPITRGFAIDIDAQLARTEPGRSPDTFKLRRWLITPGLMYRWGNTRVYGFIGGGVGAELSRTFLIARNLLPDSAPQGPGWIQVAPEVFEYRSPKTTELAYHLRTGFVVNPVRHLAIRTDVYTAWVNVMPNVGIKVGLGFRF